MTPASSRLCLTGPINAKALGFARGRIGTPLRVLVLRAWPEQEPELTAIPGFHAVDEYNADELDTLQREEIGRVMGFHIVIQYRHKSTYTEDGKLQSTVTGGKDALFIESDAP